MRLGELSRARQGQALAGAVLAPGSAATLAQLQDSESRPPVPTVPVSGEVRDFQAGVPVRLDSGQLVRALRSARRGSAGGLSGTRVEHLKVVLEDEACVSLLCDLAEAYSRAEVPPDVAETMALGRMTALSKPATGCAGL